MMENSKSDKQGNVKENMTNKGKKEADLDMKITKIKLCQFQPTYKLGISLASLENDIIYSKTQNTYILRRYFLFYNSGFLFALLF